MDWENITIIGELWGTCLWFLGTFFLYGDVCGIVCVFHLSYGICPLLKIGKENYDKRDEKKNKENSEQNNLKKIFENN